MKLWALFIIRYHGGQSQVYIFINNGIIVSFDAKLMLHPRGTRNDCQTILYAEKLITDI